MRLYSSPLRRIDDEKAREVILSRPASALTVAAHISLAELEEFKKFLDGLTTATWHGDIFTSVRRGIIDYIDYLKSRDRGRELRKYNYKELFTAMILFAHTKYKWKYTNLIIARSRK